MTETLLQQLTSEWIIEKSLLAILIAARIGGMVLAMPLLSYGLPLRFRFLIVILITVVLLPNVATVPGINLGQIPISDVMISVGRAAIFGMLIGGVVQLLVTGIQLGGELIAIAAGLQMAQTADPSTGESVPDVSRLLGLLITAVLFAAGGHRLLIDALMSSFHQVPPLSFAIDLQTTGLLMDHLAIGVEAGVRVAAPIVGCVMLSNLVVALISRTVPQLNVLAVGLNINLLAVLVVTAMTIGSVSLVFEAELSAALQRIGPAVMSGMSARSAGQGSALDV